MPFNPKAAIKKHQGAIKKLQKNIENHRKIIAVKKKQVGKK